MSTKMFDKASGYLSMMDNATSTDDFDLAERKARIAVGLAKAEAINNLAKALEPRREPSPYDGMSPL